MPLIIELMRQAFVMPENGKGKLENYHPDFGLSRLDLRMQFLLEFTFSETMWYCSRKQRTPLQRRK
ncbi:MAG: hypothetical protein B5M55_02140 [Desulfococcus sp. 4484_242]|nr:MAG: hypothetical protein B5M55_02140 [Desulfococcus sp. 4484_242]